MHVGALIWMKRVNGCSLVVHTLDCLLGSASTSCWPLTCKISSNTSWRPSLVSMLWLSMLPRRRQRLSAGCRSSWTCEAGGLSLGMALNVVIGWCVCFFTLFEIIAGCVRAQALVLPRLGRSCSDALRARECPGISLQNQPLMAVSLRTWFASLFLRVGFVSRQILGQRGLKDSVFLSVSLSISLSLSLYIYIYIYGQYLDHFRYIARIGALIQMIVWFLWWGSFL